MGSKGIIFSMIFLLFLVLTGCSSNSETNPGSNKSNADASSTGKTELFAEGFTGADGIAMDNLGNMYVGNRGNSTISKVTPGGTSSLFATVPCKELLCMTVDKDNNLYAAGRDILVKIDKDGKVKTIADGFTCADDVRLDPAGNIYVTDANENRVYKITPTLEKSIYIGNDSSESLIPYWYLTGISFSPDFKSLYLSKMSEGEILKYPIDSQGKPGKPEVVAQGLNQPDHLEIDESGNLYATCFGSYSLVRISPDGKKEVIAEGADDKLYKPAGIVFGRKGFDESSVYIANYGDSSIVKINVGAKAPQ